MYNVESMTPYEKAVGRRNTLWQISWYQQRKRKHWKKGSNPFSLLLFTYVFTTTGSNQLS